MKWFSKWFRQAKEIDSLRLDLTFTRKERNELETQLDKADAKNALLEKEIKSVRLAKDKIVLRYADQVSKQVGLPQHFVQDAVEKPAKAEPEYDAAQDAQIAWQAEVQRQADIDRGIQPEELSWYEDIIRQDPAKFIIG